MSEIPQGGDPDPIDYSLVNVALQGFTKFRIGGITKAVHELRFRLSQDIRKALSGVVEGNYCVSAYLRHVFSRECLPIVIMASDQSQALRVLQRNYRLGLQPFTRVLDSLHTDAGGARFVRVEFAPPDHADPVFKCSNYEEIHRCVGVTIDASFGTVRWPPNSGSDMPIFYKLPDETEDYETGRLLLSSDRPLFHLGVGAVETMCSYLQMESNTVAYKALIAAIYDLHTYKTTFGDHTLTLLFRSRDFTSFATGVTLVSSAEITRDQFEILRVTISQFHERICSGLVEQVENDTLTPYLANVCQFDPDGQKEHLVPKQLCDTIVCRMRKGVDRSYFLDIRHEEGAKSAVSNCIRNFLDDCVVFCDERLEGRWLQFGLVLGNPFMFRYWPGARPLPTIQRKGKEYTNLWLEKLVKQIHLIEDPDQRIVVMPYGAKFDSTESEGEVGATGFAIDLANFREAIATWPQRLMWSGTGAIYAYLTHRYPWAVGAVIGPGSQIRVFHGGQVVGHRDGKGWREWEDPTIKIRSTLEKQKGGAGEYEESLEILSQVIEVAIQLSPMIRPESHGGFIVWSAKEETFRGDKVKLQALDAVEPARLDEDARLWLTGTSLLGRQDNRWKLRYEVAKLVLRAAMNDGAVCLAGPSCKVVGFGQRIGIPGTGTYGDMGTMRATAASFVRAADGGAFAIAVSADGPIRVYYQGVRGRYRCFQDC